MYDMEYDLRCCGNCSWRNTMNMGTYIAENCTMDKEKTDSSSCVCDMWNFDDLHNKDRMIR